MESYDHVLCGTQGAPEYPTGVKYQLLSVLLLKEVQASRARIAQLEADLVKIKQYLRL